MKEIKVYGWDQQDNYNRGIQSKFVPVSELGHVNPNTGLINNLAGYWFLNFNQAKLECLAVWNHNFQVAKLALKEIKKSTPT